MPTKPNNKNENKIEVQETISRDFLEKSVKFINEKANETLYKGSLEIGEYLLKYFFNDDIKLASSKNPRKPKSFKELCQHNDLAVPYSTLTVMVRVAAQERYFKENSFDTCQLSYTHKSNLIRLNNDKNKLILANRCIDEKLSTRQLSTIVNKKRRKVIDEKKQELSDLPFGNITKIEQLLNKSIKSELITDINKLRNMRNKTRQDLKEKTNELLANMSITVKECRKLIKNLEQVEKEKKK